MGDLRRRKRRHLPPEEDLRRVDFKKQKKEAAIKALQERAEWDRIRRAGGDYWVMLTARALKEKDPLLTPSEAVYKARCKLQQQQEKEKQRAQKARWETIVIRERVPHQVRSLSLYLERKHPGIRPYESLKRATEIVLEKTRSENRIAFLRKLLVNLEKYLPPPE